MLRESFSERRSFAGCLVPTGLGVVGGGAAGYWYFQAQAAQPGSPALGVEYMGVIVGACAGLFVGALLGLVLDRVMTHRQRREEEF